MGDANCLLRVPGWIDVEGIAQRRCDHGVGEIPGYVFLATERRRRNGVVHCSAGWLGLEIKVSSAARTRLPE